MLERSEMVFVAFMQMHTDTQCAAYMTLGPCPVGLAAHHQEVREGSFVNFLGLVKTTRMIEGKMHSQSQFLNANGHSATQ